MFVLIYFSVCYPSFIQRRELMQNTLMLAVLFQGTCYERLKILLEEIKDGRIETHCTGQHQGRKARC